MRESVLQFKMPLYDAHVCVIVSESTLASVNKRSRELQASTDTEAQGVVFYSNNRFHCFLKSDELDINVLAHELFHVTHRISDWACLNFDASHHEATAQINGYLFQRVYTWLVKKGLADF